MASDDIAIIGVGCRFPGADDLSEFWQVLSNGENHVKEIPKDRWNVDAFYDKDPNAPGKTYVRNAGLTKRFDEWDHRLFGISDMEAKLMDPNQRMVLDCVHMALEDGHMTRNDIDGTHTGVYIGVMNDDFKAHVMDDIDSATAPYAMTGVHPSIVSARVSYVYNLLGPAITLDTACSSSLVAINIGYQALRQGECDIAICGGVNCIMDPSVFIALSKARMLSHTGQCQTYSADADGYARGEGCGIVILKRVADALKQENKIWSTVKTGSNQDGHTATPITAPSGTQQMDLLQRVYGQYKVDKSKVQVIEAHGTGTPVGDPIEANALGGFFTGDKIIKDRVYIGSVKSNIGHLEAAAGVAGLIKVLLMMENGTIVPSLMYTKENENPKVNLDKFGFVVPTKITTWPNQKRIACVNSFGFGGTNAHAIIEQWQDDDLSSSPAKRHTEVSHKIVTISAPQERALKENLRQFHDSLKKDTTSCSLSTLSFTSTRKRDHHAYRKAFVAENKEQLVELCNDFANTKHTIQKEQSKRKVVFVFCGVGTTWNGMCIAMLENNTFKQTVKCIDRILLPLTGWTIENKWTLHQDSVQSDPFVGHISIFACQLGLASVWKALGITADVIVGQSVGEVAAAYVAGSIDIEAAVKVIYFRSKFLAEVKGGAMLFVNNVPFDTIKKYCEKKAGALVIAVYNSPVSFTIAGEKEALKQLKQDIEHTEEKSTRVVELDVKCAYHSQHVDIVVDKLVSHLTNISGRNSKIAIISTVSGKLATTGIYGTGKYWGENIRKPVLFCDAIKAAKADTGQTIYLEIGPSPVLRLHIDNIFQQESVHNVLVLPSMTKGKELQTLSQALSTLYEYGFNPNWEAIIPEQKAVSELPKYKFCLQKSLFHNPTIVLKNQGIDISNRSHLYLQRVPDVNGNPAFKATIQEATTSFIYEHVVHGMIIVPGAFYADVGSEIGKSVLGLPSDSIEISLQFLKPTKLEKNVALVLSISTILKSDTEIIFYAKNGNSHVCKGKVRQSPFMAKGIRRLDTELIKHSFSNDNVQQMSHETSYLMLENLGFKYGKLFKIMKSCVTNKDSCLVDIELPTEMDQALDRTTLHPCILDSMMQSAINITETKTLQMIREENLKFLPVAIEKLVVYKKPQRQMLLYTTRTNETLFETVSKAHYNCILFNTDGDIIAEMTNYSTISRRAGYFTPDELTYHVTWQEIPQVKPTQSKRILMLANTQDNNNLKDLECDHDIIICLKSETPYESFISDAMAATELKWGSLHKTDAIIVIADTFNTENDLKPSDASRIYDKTKDNCMFLLELLKYMLKENLRIPLFIVTKNTQHLNSRYGTNTLNLVGSEIWGFVRSVQTEFVNGHMTIVDLQPSIKEAIKTLTDFVRSTIDVLHTCKTEIIIHQNKVYAAEFNKTDAWDVTPKYRRSKTVTYPSFANVEISKLPSYLITRQYPVCLCSELATAVKNTSVIPRETIHEKESSGTTGTEIIVKSVFLHPAVMYPATTTSLMCEPDIWQEYRQEGHTIVGLEYTGFPLPTQSRRIFRCSSNRTLPDTEDMCNRWEIASVYPSEIKTAMTVPRTCCVNVRDVPFYKPGILAMTMLFLAIAESVPTGSNVIVLCTNENQLSAGLLKEILVTSKSAKILSPDSQYTFEVVVSLNQTETAHATIQKSRAFICFKNALSPSLMRALANRKNIDVIEIDTQHIFQRKNIERLLKTVVKWVKKNSSFIKEHFETANVRDVVNTTINASHTKLKTIDATRIGNADMPFKLRVENALIKSGTYIITGGLTGLGWELLILMAEMGAGTIVTLARTAVTDDRLREIESIQDKYTCKIICIQADVCDLNSLKSAMLQIQHTEGTGNVSGVFHGAGVLDSKALINLEEHQLDRVMKPKVLGTLNLHIATKCFDLDYFLVQSSITSVIGQPGQSNYGAANAFLDTFAHWRRQKGLAAQAINWGALDVGMAALPLYKDNFEKRGYKLMALAEIRSCFKHAIMQNRTGVVYTNLEWKLVARDYSNPQMARLRPKVERVLEERDAGDRQFDDNELINTLDMKNLKKSDSKTQTKVLTNFVQQIAKRVIEAKVDAHAMTLSMEEIGMDSMSAMTFTNVIYDFCRYRISPKFIMDRGHSLTDVVTYLLDELRKGDKTTGNDIASNH